MTSTTKSASTASAIGTGAGSGALVGALATIFDENPNLKSLVKNTLIGGGAGALAGGVYSKTQGTPAPEAPAPAEDPAKKMKLSTAAVTGLLPGFGPAIHGGIEGGVAQGVGSGAASLLGAQLAAGPAVRKAMEAGKTVPGKVQALGFGGSILGSLLAATAGNKLRES